MMRYIVVGLILAMVATAQNASMTSRGRHLDIPAISRAANGSVVSVVMSDKDGHPIAQGSGFLISKDGHVITNYHVIRNGTSAVVKLPGGTFFAVDGVLAFDKHRDIAIIKAHGSDFRPLNLGDSDRLQVGQEVVAIGNPLSLESTVSNGIISALRTVEDEGGKFVQITAPISHGSSGGPLFNMSGEVVGITSAALVGGENLNFAIPINDAKQLLRMPDLQALRALPNEPENEAEDHTAAEDPIVLDEDGATGFAEMFAVEPACGGLTLSRDWSAGGHWIIGVSTMHELYKNSFTQDPSGRTFLSWHRLTHYTAKEHDCTLRGVSKRCQDVDKEFNVYALIGGNRDADKIPDYCFQCTTSTPPSLDAGVKAVCALVKGADGRQVK